MVNFTKGFTFTDSSGATGHTATSVNLGTLISGAGISLIDYDELSDEVKPIHVMEAEPSDTDDDKVWWWKDSVETFYIKRGGYYDPIGGKQYKNISGSQINKGMIVEPYKDGANIGIKPMDTSGVLAVNHIGVAIENIADGSYGTVMATGIQDVLYTGTTYLPGQMLICVAGGYTTAQKGLPTEDLTPYSQLVGIALDTCVSGSLIPTEMMR